MFPHSVGLQALLGDLYARSSSFRRKQELGYEQNDLLADYHSWLSKIPRKVPEAVCQSFRITAALSHGKKISVHEGISRSVFHDSHPEFGGSSPMFL